MLSCIPSRASRGSYDLSLGINPAGVTGRSHSSRIIWGPGLLKAGPEISLYDCDSFSNFLMVLNFTS